MKTITLLAYLFLFSISIYAQIPGKEFPVGKGGLQTDSMILRISDNNKEKTTAKYLPDGKMIEKADYAWDEKTKNWRGKIKENIEYNALGKCLLRLQYGWNSDVQEWQIDYSAKNEYSYDGWGNLVLNTFSIWSEYLKDWNTQIIERNEYDENNRKILYERYPNAHSPIVRTEYSYNDGKLSTEMRSQNGKYTLKKAYIYEGNSIKINYYRWDVEANTWLEFLLSTEETVYDEKNRLIFEKSYVFDEERNLDPIGSYIREYLYNEDDNPKVWLYYFWDGAKQDWFLSWKFEYEYYQKDNLNFKSEGVSVFEKENNSFIKYSFLEQGYDLYGNEVYYYNWDASIGGGYIYEKKIIGSLNENNQLISKIHYFREDQANDWEQNLECFYDEYGNLLSETSSDEVQYLYYYSTLPADIQQSLNNISITISPNPVCDVFFINGLNNKAELFLSNINGQAVFYQKEIENNSSVSITSLPLGIYIAKIVSGKDSITKKIVKR